MSEHLQEENGLFQEIEKLPWFHSIDLGNGIVTPGRAELAHLKAQANAFFDEALKEKAVLDIGCYDGFYSFEAYRRGAKRVVATDHFIWQDDRCRQAFELARRRVAPNVEVLELDIADITPERVGTFDVVLFTGVLYHLRHPLQALEQVARLVSGTLVLETHLDAVDFGRPAMVFYPNRELNDDPSNWWGPNRLCIEAMLRDVGFASIGFQANPVYPSNRGIFHARRGGVHPSAWKASDHHNR
jgi:tRNA (mo5U34)-methyltransferase